MARSTARVRSGHIGGWAAALSTPWSAASAPTTTGEAEEVLENVSGPWSRLCVPGGEAPAPTRTAPEEALDGLNGSRHHPGNSSKRRSYTPSSSDSPPWPAAATTRTPLAVAYRTAAKSSGHHSSAM
ncbi:hypothetical protein ABT063_23620 [Streptomyces sp. NPDC002838]|uniref:hypothetical protein n=1 Tax=Streptomyces sp. NPDC002838 TaxID=3154436 RepID=UPI003324A2B7